MPAPPTLVRPPTFLDAEKAPRGIKDLYAYLEHCGGSEVLHFSANNEAREAAWKIRETDSRVQAEARYNSVLLRI